MTAAEEKSALRRERLSVRHARSAARRLILDDALKTAIAASPEYKEADTLLLFFPVRDEPDLLSLALTARLAGKTVGFPRTERGGMSFFRVTGGGDFTEGEYGIPVPRGNEEIVPTKKTLLLVPLLALDGEGNRLGYGGGYFDRLLRDFPGHVLGVLYSEDLLPRVPTEPHDIPLSAFVTERGVTHIR